MSATDSQIQGIVARHLNAALAELSVLGMTDDDSGVYLLEVLAEEATWQADSEDPRWDVVQGLLTHDQPPFHGEAVATEVCVLVMSLASELLALIEMRSNPSGDEYARERAERVDADFAVLGRIVHAASAWHLLPVPVAGLRS